MVTTTFSDALIHIRNAPTVFYMRHKCFEACLSNHTSVLDFKCHWDEVEEPVHCKSSSVQFAAIAVMVLKFS